MSILAWLLLGLIAGFIASKIVNKTGEGFVLDIVIGIVGALCICHNTRYRYRQPVALGPHRLMLRPRESRDVQLRASELAITPQATVTWAQNVFGNTVATANFDRETDTLDIRSRVELELRAHPWPVFDIAASALSYPFRYSDEEMDRSGGAGD